MQLKAYRLSNHAIGLAPTALGKEGQQNPNPLSPANQSAPVAGEQGWHLLCPAAFTATWNGGARPEDIEIRYAKAAEEQFVFVQSQQGAGRLTFYPGYQFKTPNGYALWVCGPRNGAKDGIAPLEQIVETALLPATVTIHWQFTRPHKPIHFAAGEPLATLLPYPQSSLNAVQVEIVQQADAGESAGQQVTQAGAAQLINPPGVSCICPTYGRVALLEEALHSFLQQDYSGPKELIILNDYDQQTLHFDHPEVRIVNLPKRFHSVGEKYKAAVALASHDLIFVWHDDDIYLPHRLAYSVAHFDQNTTFFKADKAWFWNDGKLSGPEQNLFHGGSCWQRALFRAVHGYPHIGHHYDTKFEQLCKAEAPDAMCVESPKPAEIYYIYRWQGTGSYHFSTIASNGQEESQVAAYVAEQAGRGAIPQGEIHLKPCWRSDYAALVQKQLAASTVPPENEFDTIDGRLDLAQFEQGFFLPNKFFGQDREEHLRKYGEIELRTFYVLDALKLVYLPIPKVACTAIKLALAKAIGITFAPDDDVEQLVHYHPQWTQKALRLSESLRRHYRFAFVRNPFDRLVSCYRGKILFQPTPKIRSPLYKNYCFALPVNCSFADFARRVSQIPDALADGHFKSQYAFLYGEDGVQVDFIGKFEHLAHDWQPIAAKYGLDPALAVANVSKAKPGSYSDYRLYYTEPLVDLVYARYRRDIETFGYEEEYEQLLTFVHRQQR